MKLANDDKRHKVIISSILETEEFKALHSELDHIYIFSEDCIEEPSKIIKTGARHSAAKYLLLPARLRKKYTLSKYDFKHLEVGHLKAKGSLFLIYEVPEKGLAKTQEKNNP